MFSDTYDFIIVGGGTAGLVVAARLSEVPSQRILVLEAGADLSSDQRIKTPASWTSLQGTGVDWGFRTEAQPLLNGRSIGVSQGKVLGGSSAINAQVFVPCNPSVIDHWGSSLGNNGWSWETLRPYFAKAYTSPPIDSSLAETLGIDGWTDHSSTHGPLPTSFPGNQSHPIRKVWADTFRANGYYHTKDPFIDGALGSFSCLATVDPVTNERTDAASAYYQPHKTRDNLTVLTKSTVEKILFDDENQNSEKKSRVASGVIYSFNGEHRKALCNKEVIIAGGALQSPKILELSGIGNSTMLEKHGIECIIDLPGVGENLYDHLIDTISYGAVDSLETLDPLILNPSAREQAANDFAERRTGLLTSMGVYTYAYLPIIEHISREGRERLTKLLREHRPTVGEGPDQARARAYYRVAEETLLDPKQASGAYLSYIGPWGAVEENARSLTLCAMLSQPLSRGSVHISSKDTSAAPIINPNYLSNPLDLNLYAEHMLYIETMARLSPLNDLLKHPIVRRDPSSNLTDLETAKEWIQKSAASMWHLGGSCAMLPKDMNGVVDSTLKVYGTRNLRIVDSSAIPLISTANLQATVYAFAERAADLIKETWGLE
ncbi:putative GMC oxidoreductase [Annulohypoxylon nitens]|nr:putative GMC oxidoreductase [Annulohypoxylon nitens]